mgnify:CR=1 FL=1
MFTYSHEEDTSAHTLNDSLSPEEKEERAQEIIAFQQDISLEKNQAPNRRGLSFPEYALACAGVC